MKRIYFVLLLLSSFVIVNAQETKTDKVEKTPFDKKLYLGAAFNNSWTRIDGTDGLGAKFYKPSLGGHLRMEYYFLDFLGVSASLGYQQRGSGIKTPDYFRGPGVMGLGDPDSTHRLRLRFNCIDVPLSLVFRTPKEIIKGVKVSGGVGVIAIFNMRSSLVWHSVEDGFHEFNKVNNDFFKNDIALNGLLGVDIDAGGANIFQVHLSYNMGTNNVFRNNTLYPNYNSKNQMYGIRLSWLY